MDVVKIDHLSKTVISEGKSLEIFRDLNFNIEKGKFHTMIGPSGSGKSTILRILARLIESTSGQITWENPQPKISFVFQSFGLFPYLTVFENIEFGLKMQGIKDGGRHKKVQTLIEEMGLSGFETKHPKELSGGMKQRVGIARALAMEPDLMLLDEPFSSLDELTAENLRAQLLKIWQERQMTIFMVTHLIEEAYELSDQVIVLTPKENESQKIIEIKESRPRNLRSQKFFDFEDHLKILLI